MTRLRRLKRRRNRRRAPGLRAAWIALDDDPVLFCGDPKNSACCQGQ
jgi:hypothetical protein